MRIQGINVGNLMVLLLNRQARAHSYDKWSHDFKLKHQEDAIDHVIEGLSKLNFKEMTKEELEFLGFAKWAEHEELMLIPLWIYDAIPDGTELKNIFGDIVVKGKGYVDMDDRFGSLAYGVCPKNLEESE